MKKKWLKLLGKIIVIISALFFIQTGIPKLLGTEQMVDMIHELGYPTWILIIIGLLEIIGGIALLIPKTIKYAACGLAIMMIGAVISHLMNGQIFEALIPGQWLIVLVLIWRLTPGASKR